MTDQDSLLRTRDEFLLGHWIADARKMGSTESEKNLFERNARALITTWEMNIDGNLHEYSHREWAGLTKYYYMERWKLFIADLAGRLNGKAAKNYNFFTAFERPWQTKYTQVFSTETEGDEIAMSSYIYNKYMPLLGYKLSNNSPIVSAAVFTIPENQAAGTVVGNVMSTDPDAGQKLNYSVYNQSVDNAFGIDANTGQITVKDAAAMNQALNPSFSLLVKVSDNGTPAYSVYSQLKIDLTTDIQSVKSDLSSTIFVCPNPAKNTLTVNLPIEESVKVKVIDTAGKIVLQDNMSEKSSTLNIEKLNRGAYFLAIEGKTLNKTIRFLAE